MSSTRNLASDGGARNSTRGAVDRICESLFDSPLIVGVWPETVSVVLAACAGSMNSQEITGDVVTPMRLDLPVETGKLWKGDLRD